MFGYVVADRSGLGEAARLRYRQCYCGLCRCIGKKYGTLHRAALNYDMTFLILLLSSLYEPAEAHGRNRCVVHPVAPSDHWENEITEYAAAMNMALAYHNCMDDWHDDQHLKSYFLANVFRSAANSVEKQYPRQWHALERCMSALKTIEANNLQDPDQGAAAFGSMLGELFVYREDRWSDLLRKMGESLGRYIYLLDALIDLQKDMEAKAYNPFETRYLTGLCKLDYLPVLKNLMGECTDALERLPLLQDLDILRNILYSGVWIGYYKDEQHSKKEGSHVG